MPKTQNIDLSNKTKGILYLIPSTLGSESQPNDVLPELNRHTIESLSVFIVEELKTARRFLKRINKDINIDALEFLIFNEHTVKTDLEQYITPLLNGRNVGLLSEAGLPCIADPGKEIVSEAHEHRITVKPLTGPSSILLALIASGFNGQNFAFHGYLPVEKMPRQKKIKQLEASILPNFQTQIFIETPYRNNQLMTSLLETCQSETLLCVAADISLPTEQIISTSISRWRKIKYDFNKRPAVFLLYQ